ncbi:hypothetical protein J7F03_28715 [Streptomyces sp. ISL-43]|uniref:hypothetical protein n=1 Tax=Streptomyces sp. ISL-43 TaxID=2819183 RepID=UPI001BE99E07|nr:hypothetical protein [Streptomyces sp. ISL-43]MBT2450989.1 hypothetical protein [Streptomyces sp. ISL-43]
MSAEASPGPGKAASAASRVAGEAAWAAADAATRRFAAATMETLDTRETVQRLARRYAALANAQRAGYLFEVEHALSFNQAAARAGAGVRAVVSEWMAGGSQTAAADVLLVDGAKTVGQVQAKLMASASGTAHQIRRGHYTGMTRLVAGDKVAAVDSLLQRRLTMNPDGIGFADYADAHAHLGDSIRYGAITSQPVDLADAHRHATDPEKWMRGRVRQAAGREAAAAAATGAAAGAAAEAAIAAAGQLARIRAGETSPAQAALTAAAAAARGAARSGSLAGLASLVRTAGRAGQLPAAFGGGELASATATAALAVAEAGLQLAQGRIDGGEFAARGAEAALHACLTWACGAVAQSVIPVPVVGALVGGLVGQAAGTVIVQGLQAAVVIARGTRTTGTLTLEHELLAASLTTGLLATATATLGPRTHTGTTVLPALAPVREHLTGTDPARALSSLAALTAHHAGVPLHLTPAEFDAWMTEPDDLLLVLNPNW